MFCRIVIVLIIDRARADVDGARGDLPDEVAQLRQLAAQVVVDVDEVLPVAAGRRERVTGASGRAGVVPGSARPGPHGRSGDRRRPSVGADGGRERCSARLRRQARRDPAGRAAVARRDRAAAGATSAANRPASGASSRMKALMPSSRASPASCSAQSRRRPRRKPVRRDRNLPWTL